VRDLGRRREGSSSSRPPYMYLAVHICVSLSCKKENIEENTNVDAITRSIAPTYASTSACAWCMPTCFVLQGDVTPSHPTEGTVTFQEESPGDMIMASNADASVALIDSTPDLQLGSFLNRPVTIDTFSWSTTDPVGVTRTITPWSLFMNSASVKTKLNNYAFFRGKLHIKVVINATPFQYGLMKTAYTPLQGLVPNRVRTTTSDFPLRIPYSQQPGFYISPQTNEGGEMECPFLYHKNWLDITSLTDVQNMGTLRYVTFAPLAVAISTAPLSITVKTIAWLTDVELMGATAKLALQGDEYGKGSVSKPATTVACVASMLTQVPILGPFARATQIGATAVASIASVFGYTNPPVISNVEPRYIMSAPHLATAEISVPYQKLAYDPKTELSIDAAPFGGPKEDELSINYLKKKESFFGSTVWSTSDSESLQIFNTRITPTLKDSFPILTSGAPFTTVGYRHYNTPLSHLSYMFNNWRGTLKIRMRVVCSKYHKGRLKISWDPVSDVTAGDPELNVCYNQIIDIGETQDVVFEIPYHQSRAWAITDAQGDKDGWTLGSPNPPVSTTDNGVLSVRVYNTLEAPSTTSVTLLFYISAGDDFEFNNPKGGINAGGDLYVPSFFALQGDVSEHTVGKKSNASDKRYHLNFGESVISLRKLLHRSSVVDTVPLPNGAVSSTNIYRKGIFRIPYTPGYVPATSFTWPTTASKVVDNLVAGSYNFAFNTMHPIPFVASMFVGTRGSVNYTLTVNSPKVVPDDIRVTRFSDTGGVTALNRIVTLNASVAGTASLSTKCSRLGSYYYVRDGAAGMALTSARAAPSVQFCLPDYNPCNFTLVNPLSWVEGSTIDDTDKQGALVSLNIANTTATDEIGYSTVITNAGTGVDFTCFYFLCCPTIDNMKGDAIPTP